MRILLDTNILIDTLDNNRPGAEVANALVKWCETNDIQGYISALSVPNMLYIMRKGIPSREYRDNLVRLLCWNYEIIPLERGDLMFATGEDFCDYEDGLQILAAEKVGVDCIVTNDKRGFRSAKMEVLTPREFLERAGA